MPRSRIFASHGKAAPEDPRTPAIPKRGRILPRRLLGAISSSDPRTNIRQGWAWCREVLGPVFAAKRNSADDGEVSRPAPGSTQQIKGSGGPRGIGAKDPQRPTLEPVPIHGRENHRYAECLRREAELIDGFSQPISGYALVVIHGDGARLTYYEGPSYFPLLGAIDVLRTHVMKDLLD